MPVFTGIAIKTTEPLPPQNEVANETFKVKVFKN